MQKRTRKKTSLDRAFEAVATPLFVLDRQRKVVFFNAGCQQITGWSSDEIVGGICDYVSDANLTTVDSVTGSLAPPPEVLSGNPASVPTYLANRNGTVSARRVNFFPLTDANNRVEWIVGIVTPIEAPGKPVETTPAQQAHAELAALRHSLRERFGPRTLVCRSSAMTRVAQQIQLAQRSHVGVFLRGESGTGKEYVARLIHYQSELGNRSFVPLDCSRLPPLEMKLTLRRILEDDDEPGGTATSVSTLQPGTVLLKQVDLLPRDLQQMLIDSTWAKRTTSAKHLRFMGSTECDHHKLLEKETLLPAFVYLMTPLEIELPPLRDRREDITPLAQSMLEEFNRGEDQQVGGFSEDVWKKFEEYNWPGNARELHIVVKEARSSSNGLIQINDLPFRFRTGFDAQSVGPPVKPRPIPLETLLTEFESEQIQLALDQCKFNKSKAARLLGMTRAKLYRRMQTLDITDYEGSE